MDKIPFDVLIHSENALIRALELKTVLDELTENNTERGGGGIYFLLSALC